MIPQRVYLQFSAIAAAAALVAACGGGSETAAVAEPPPSIEGPREAASSPAATPAAAPASAPAAPAPGPTTVQCDGTVRQWFGTLKTSVQFVVPSDTRPVNTDQCNHFSIGQNRYVACTAKIDAGNQVSIEVNGFPVLTGPYTASGNATWRMGAEDVAMVCAVPAPAPGASAPAPFTQSAPTPAGSTPAPPPPPAPRETAAAAAWLTPTGINAAQCYQSGTSTFALCAGAAATALNPRQDGHRADTQTPMSYSQVRDFPLTSCVKDNLTGLIWEGKEAGGLPNLRAHNAAFTNYDSTVLPQVPVFDPITAALISYRSPTQVEIDSTTNSVGYAKYVNGLALCGYTDWRVPTVVELHSLVDYGVSNTSLPMINLAMFPNMQLNTYFSSTAGLFVGDAQYVSFSGGFESPRGRNSPSRVRLVRGSR